MSRALQQALDAAFRTHQAGQLDEAERLYRKVLRGDPLNADALHLFGLLHHQRGQSAKAEELIAKAVKRRPDAVFYENLAAVQKSRGALAAVIETCRAGLARAPSQRLTSTLIDTLMDSGQYAEALAVLDTLGQREAPAADRLADRAFCLLRLGRRHEAAASAERSLAIDGMNGNALLVLAEIASDSGNPAQAVDLWRRALAGRPDWVAARINLGFAQVKADGASAALDTLLSIAIPADPSLAAQLLNGRSAAYRASEKPDLARRCLEAALVLVPGSAELLSNLSELRRPDRVVYAQHLAERAIAVDPSAASAHSNRGLALEELDRLGEAMASSRRAIALAPSDPRLLNNLGGALRWLGRFEAVETTQYRSLAADPVFAPALYGLGTVQLTRGDLRNGWLNYDSRTRDKQIQASRPFRQPSWQGLAHSRGRLLVWGEQGLGDEIVHGSMLPDLERSAIGTIVECDPRMVSLFSRALPSMDFVARRTPPDERLEGSDITAQVPMGSLAKWYRACLEDFAGKGAYLQPRQDLLDHWRERLAGLGDGPKIGFAWRSSRIDGLARRFHPPILEWAPVLSQREATFISLQYGEVGDDIRAAESAFGMTLHQFPALDLKNDLEGVLALSAAVDLVISTGTTAFCFPAAAGVPVWLATPESDYWTFGTDRYPWFSTVRVYGHRYADPWSATIGRIGVDLAAHLDKRQNRRL